MAEVTEDEVTDPRDWSVEPGYETEVASRYAKMSLEELSREYLKRTIGIATSRPYQGDDPVEH